MSLKRLFRNTYYFNFRIEQLQIHVTVIMDVMKKETVVVTLLMWDVFVSREKFHLIIQALFNSYDCKILTFF